MVVIVICVWMISEMALVKVAVYVGRIRSGQSAYDTSPPAIRKSESPEGKRSEVYAPRSPAEEGEWARTRARNSDHDRPVYADTKARDGTQSTVECWGQ